MNTRSERKSKPLFYLSTEAACAIFKSNEDNTNDFNDTVYPGIDSGNHHFTIFVVS